MGAYSSFLRFIRFEVSSINAPNASMKRPDQRFTLKPSEEWYISASPLVTIPHMVRMIPSILNINPIGIFISNPMIFDCFDYQNIKLNARAMIPTTAATKPGF